MENDVKSRGQQAVPKPGGIERLSEDEKRALELEGEIEHAHGRQREEIAERAEAVAGGEQKQAESAGDE